MLARTTRNGPNLQQAKEDVKVLAEAGAARAMEDPLLPERPGAPERAQIGVAAKFVQSTEGGPRTAKDHMILAYDCFQKENYTLAANLAEQALPAAPPNLDAVQGQIASVCYEGVELFQTYDQIGEPDDFDHLLATRRNNTKPTKKGIRS